MELENDSSSSKCRPVLVCFSYHVASILLRMSMIPYVHFLKSLPSDRTTFLPLHRHGLCCFRSRSIRCGLRMGGRHTSILGGDSAVLGEHCHLHQRSRSTKGKKSSSEDESESSSKTDSFGHTGRTRISTFGSETTHATAESSATPIRSTVSHQGAVSNAVSR